MNGRVQYVAGGRAVVWWMELAKKDIVDQGRKEGRKEGRKDGVSTQNHSTTFIIHCELEVEWMRIEGGGG